MGMIKRIFFIFFILFFCNVSAQTDVDTIYFDGDQFVKHFVKAGESLKSISDKYKVSIDNIIDNNEIQKQLYYNQLLYIPILTNNQQNNFNKSNIDISNNKRRFDQKILKSNIFNSRNSLSYQKNIKNSIPNDINISNEFNDSSILNIALLMPYSIVNKDLSDISLSFHLGVELALDSLRKQGKNICLYTFDTQKDTFKVQQIIRSKVLDDMDIIIGPLFAINFKILCDRYGNDTSKVLISPLSRNTDNVKKYRAVHHLSLSVRVQINIIKEYILSHHRNDRVIVLTEEISDEVSVRISNLFENEDKSVEIFKMESTDVSAIRAIFKQKQVVIIPSENQPFVSKLLASIGGVDSTSLVFGLYDWKTYDNLDPDNLMFLDVKFPNAYGINYFSSHDISFLRLFEDKYKTNNDKYSYIAYNILMHFCSDYSYFRLKNLKNGGKINTFASLYHYVDYLLVPVD